jgi:formamidopyrimidine-DNA glycosylase
MATITDRRRLGRIRLAHDPAGEPPISLLGFDVLTSLPSAAELQRRLGIRRGPIKAVLLDQSLFAGVGNWMADEVLYQAKISPLRAANELSEVEVRRLRAALKSVADQAVAVDADAEQFPRTWIFHRRWDHRIGTGPRGESLVRQQIGGRTTTWAPSRQK